MKNRKKSIVTQSESGSGAVAEIVFSNLFASWTLIILALAIPARQNLDRKPLKWVRRQMIGERILSLKKRLNLVKRRVRETAVRFGWSEK